MFLVLTQQDDDEKWPPIYFYFVRTKLIRYGKRKVKGQEGGGERRGGEREGRKFRKIL